MGSAWDRSPRGTAALQEPWRTSPSAVHPLGLFSQDVHNTTHGVASIRLWFMRASVARTCRSAASRRNIGHVSSGGENESVSLRGPLYVSPPDIPGALRETATQNKKGRLQA